MDKLSRTDWQIGVSALLLFIGVIAFPWFSISTTIEGVTLHVGTLTAVDGPDAIFGVLAMLGALAVLADLAIERFAPQVQIPPLGGSREMGRFILAVATAVFIALKFLTQIHFNYFGWGFYICVILTAVLVYSALEARRGPLT